MKKFWLFGFDRYYPSGGMNDFIEAFDSVSEAVEKSKQSERDFHHIVNSETGEVTSV